MLADRYQYSLIALSVALTGMFGYFVYRELFPEYKIYQEAYVGLEDLRAEHTGVPAPSFKYEIKQIVIPKADLGPETIDRCVSCHVAMKLTHFSPTKIATDINGKPILDEAGMPVQVPNEEYVWGQLDEKVASLRAEGKEHEADRLEELKTIEIGENSYDMTKVLAMHPLIGRESMPFEYHSLEEYGCTSCHSGNGRGLVTDRAHGPVVDGTYEEAAMGHEPQFTERDPENDPFFAKVFNHKPGHRLLFQTSPLLVGSLMQAKCVQCHQTSKEGLDSVVGSLEGLTQRKMRQLASVQASIGADREALVTLLALDRSLAKDGLDSTLKALQDQEQDFKRSPDERKKTEAQLAYLQSQGNAKRGTEAIRKDLQQSLVRIVGTKDAANALATKASAAADLGALVDSFLAQGNLTATPGSIVDKSRRVQDTTDALQRIQDVRTPLQNVVQNRDITQSIHVETDKLTLSYQHGEELFHSSACYACHKIEGLSRGGVGPELTEIGLFYPWYIKESIVWPQGNLPSSTMPNYKLDSEDVESLMTFLLAQRKESKAVAEYARTVQVKAWDAGAKKSWEQPLAADKIRDIHNSMRIFATEGCAACHRLKGFDSAVGFAVEKQGGDFEKLFEAQQWFETRFPDDLAGSILVSTIDSHAKEIDSYLVGDAHAEGLVEELMRDYPGLIDSFYSNFKYAYRAKNAHFDSLQAQAQNDTQRLAVDQGRAEWKQRLDRILMQYIQQYGMGRHIGPNLHWSGVYRDTEWLVGHFRNPGAHTAKSIMPVLPFDDTKFYALTHMLQVVGQKNRDATRQIWEKRGFDPSLAYEMHCASCHGEFMGGNGPIAEWIYPIPKNLRNANFLRNLTKERAVLSIHHGVLGGPMPPWGEAPLVHGREVGSPVLTVAEIDQLVDWLYQALPGSRVIRNDEDVNKWQYTPEDVLKDLKKEGNLWRLEEGVKDSSTSDAGNWKAQLSALQPDVSEYFCALEPQVAVNASSEVEQVFDVVENPIQDGPDKKMYYLKRKYFTPENVAEGKRLFVANCSHCHGKEGGGNGERATTMEDAKPRMLSNLPWLRTRDDLRILRSIKYGVPGTSMTPWGDKTDTLQRIQIVTFIRSLTDERRHREDLSSQLFEAFERDVIAVEAVRSVESVRLTALREQYRKAMDKRLDLFLKLEKGVVGPEEASKAYSDELAVLQQVKGAEGVDSLLTTIVDELRKEQGLYEKLGRNMIAKHLDDAVIKDYLSLIAASQGRFTFEQNQLVLHADKDLQLIEQHGQSLLTVVEAEIAKYEAMRDRLEGQVRSAERSKQLGEVEEELKAFVDLRAKLITTLEEAKRSRQKQISLYQTFRSNRDTAQPENTTPTQP
ncbi:MAG: c-type cytochrome [Chlamydiia bacterium]|nr:c-type cytochrome [Chlamydiia bacterium]